MLSKHSTTELHPESAIMLLNVFQDILRVVGEWLRMVMPEEFPELGPFS
jgi:hypothetical protein